MLPPNVKMHWNDNEPGIQWKLIAYGQIRELEDSEIISKTMRPPL